MLRRSILLAICLVTVSGLATACIPRHPPHTPKPVSEDDRPSHKTVD